MLCSLHMLGSDSLRVVLDVLWSLFCNQRAKLALHMHPLQAPLDIHPRHSPSALTLFIMVLPLRPRPRQPQLRPRLRLRMRLRLRLRLQLQSWQILLRTIMFFSWHTLLRTRNARQRELKQLYPKPPAAAGRRLPHPLPSMPADCPAAVDMFMSMSISMSVSISMFMSMSMSMSMYVSISMLMSMSVSRFMIMSISMSMSMSNV